MGGKHEDPKCDQNERQVGEGRRPQARKAVQEGLKVEHNRKGKGKGREDFIMTGDEPESIRKRGALGGILDRKKRLALLQLSRRPLP